MVRVGAFALIFNPKNDVLLCHRRDLDLWSLPSGGMEAGETPWEAVIREVGEEVGLIVEVERLVGVYAKPEQGEIVFSFVCRVIAGEPGTSTETDEVAYFPVEQLPHNTIPKQVERIRDGLHGADRAVLKVQAGPSSRDMLRSGECRG